ncbi:hypothetical protein [Actinoplanes sp. GCM10030250]|uniref:hypothetical protein n=1 Tax=Actinoplanes sp. GCM10030250 TaxID=3273376 RepID=UPI0036089EA4
MIVASFLLIPVAVLFLALGLINGSSSLLIASIVVSLLAAVALVIGARQAAAARRDVVIDPAGPAPEPAGRAGPMPEPADPMYEPADPMYEPAGPMPQSAGRSAPEAPVRGDRPEPFADDSASAVPGFAGDSVRYDDDPGLADQVGAAHAPPAAERSPADAYGDVDEARAAGARDTAAHLGDEREPVVPGAADYAQTDSAPHSGQSAPGQSAPGPSAPGQSAPGPSASGQSDSGETSGDYRQASSTIDAARSAGGEDHRWRRPAEPSPDAPDEFAEPDDDDPDDEPLPQSVRPADAVLIARLDLEVLVVDGRPRYHLADCPHLVGRLTEPLPANEAVELGFSPCGLCRPVDRLVATVAHR